MNYRIELVGDTWNIVEVSKDNEIILSFPRTEERTAKDTYRKMKHGIIGFNGWTPSFMTRKIDTSGFDESC